MRITQGTFSFLPDLSDAQITKQIDHCLANRWAIGLSIGTLRLSPSDGSVNSDRPSFELAASNSP